MAKAKKKRPKKSRPKTVAKKQNKWLMPTSITAVIAVAIIVAVIVLKGGGNPGGTTADVNAGETNVSANAEEANTEVNTKETSTDDGATAVKDADLVIPIAEISTTAMFYPVEIDGTKLEVIAVEAPDGSIRTAFNTCQVCYDSGRGYYKQEGNVLVCQNCGNRFQMNQVEVQSGGCNPVPIFSDNKTVDEENITISRDYLTQAKGIFANWKSSY